MLLTTVEHHRWIGEDEGLVRCLTCGGLWNHDRDVRDYTEIYFSNNGQVPTECPGAIDICHHYPNECPLPEGQECLMTDCNCLSCDS